MNHVTQILRLLSEGVLTEEARPGKIIFKRGTVIDADHIVYIKQGFKAKRAGIVKPYLLIGLEPMYIPMERMYQKHHDETTMARMLRNCNHEDFWGLRSIQPNNPADDWEDRWGKNELITAGRYFRKIFTANLRNVHSIDGLPPEEWILRNQ